MITGVRLAWLALAARRPLSGRGAVLVLGKAPCLGILLEAAAGCLADRIDDLVCSAKANLRFGCRHHCCMPSPRSSSMRLGRGFTAARTGFWSAIGICDAAWGIGVGLYHIDRCGVAAVLGGGALRLHSGARRRTGGAGGSLAGVAIGIGLLAKYAMAYWILSALGFVLAIAFRAPSSCRGCSRRSASPCVIYSPNLWWNWRHGFVSYLHTRDNAEPAVAVPPKRISRIFCIAIRRLRPIVVCRADWHWRCSRVRWPSRAPDCSPSLPCRHWR